MGADMFRRAALRGHPEAQLQAGRALEHGIGTSQNLHEAFLMYEQSAKAGYAPGQNAYGVFLKKGLGTPRDDRKALEWLTKAAQGGSPDAHFHIGELHEQGRAGLPKSRVAAMEWYRRAPLSSEEARRALQALRGRT
jgi:TPR repeat protein